MRRARRVGLAIDASLAKQLEAYYSLLAIWNLRINLTALKLADTSSEALDRLLIEPLVAARHIPLSATRIMDVGSGGGSPAIPMALALPGTQLVMVESKTRKSVFLREATRALSLSRADVVNARFEELLARPDLHEASDVLTIRAVRIERRTLTTAQAFVKPGGLVFLFRASSGSDPSDSITPPLSWKATYPLIETIGSRLVVLEKRTVGRTTNS